MIWPFKPRCPLSLIHKVQCERRFAAIARLIGKHRSTPPPVATLQDVESVTANETTDALPSRLHSFVAGRFPLPVPPTVVKWGMAEELSTGNHGHMYHIGDHSNADTRLVSIHPALQDSPGRLAALIASVTATLALQENAASGAFTTDAAEILPLFFGFGTVMANAGLKELADTPVADGDEHWSTTATVTALDYGYTMALSDWSLGTNYLSASTEMRPDAGETLNQGLRFLQRTNDCSFERDVFDSSATNISAATSRLRSHSCSKKLGALHDLLEGEEVPEDLVTPLAEQLNDREAQIRQSAAVALARCPVIPPTVHEELLFMVEDSESAVRRAAMSALRPGLGDDSNVLDALTERLSRSDAATAAVCINTLLRFDDYTTDINKGLLKALSTIVLEADPTALAPGVQLLKRVDSDARETINRHFADDLTALAVFNQAFESLVPATE